MDSSVLLQSLGIEREVRLSQEIGVIGNLVEVYVDMLQFLRDKFISLHYQA